MAVEYNGDDATHGKNVKWYQGGSQKTETKTLTGTDESNGYIALAAKAEYGSVQLKVDGVFTACDQFSDVAGVTPATDAAGVQSIEYSGLAEDDEVVLYYLDITTDIVQVGICKDVKSSWSADSTKEVVHGQSNKLTISGVMEQTAELEALYYNQTLVNSFCGDQVTDTAGNKQFSTKYSAFSKIGALVGIKTDGSGNVTKKWFLYGCEPDGMDKEFPADGLYSESFKLNVDDYCEFEIAA